MGVYWDPIMEQIKKDRCLDKSNILAAIEKATEEEEFEEDGDKDPPHPSWCVCADCSDAELTAEND